MARSMSYRTIVVAFLTLAVCSGQSVSANKYAGEFLTHGVGARALGMGSAFVAVADDVTAGYWNPAGVVDAREHSLQLMHAETFGDVVNYDTGAYVHPLDENAAYAVTFVRLAIDDIPFTDFHEDEARIYYNEADITWESDSEMAALFTYGRRVSGKLRLGASLKLIAKSIELQERLTSIRLWSSDAMLLFALNIGRVEITPEVYPMWIRYWPSSTTSRAASPRCWPTSAVSGTGTRTSISATASNPRPAFRTTANFGRT